MSLFGTVLKNQLNIGKQKMPAADKIKRKARCQLALQTSKLCNSDKKRAHQQAGFSYMPVLL
jgi:hypothetical protein